MNSLPEDLLAMILVKLPIKIFTTFKIVCKQWESMVDSPYFRDLFLSIHQNSHYSSWSILSRYDEEVIAHYGCNTWGLQRSLHFYISSFLTKKFETQRNNYKVWSYSTDVGMILISESCFFEYVEIPSHGYLKKVTCPLGIAARTENGVLLDYKVVLFNGSDTFRSLLIYSSEIGMCSINTVDLTVSGFYNQSPISLHGSIHWIASTSHSEDVAVSFDLYATGTSSVQCRVTTFPDFGQHPKFTRSFSTCHGSLIEKNGRKLLPQC
ncbi:putative F-box protein [Arabidopsis thaliana]